MKGREASIAARLKNVAIEKGISFQYATLLYMHEGLLWRLAASPYRERFALKGGLLLQCLTESGGRSTKDIDVLGSGIENDAESIRAIFVSMARISADDGLRFDDEAMVAEASIEGAEYHGVRIRLPCYLGTIKIFLTPSQGFIGIMSFAVAHLTAVEMQPKAFPMVPGASGFPSSPPPSDSLTRASRISVLRRDPS